jgi:hypothetical protein
MFTGSPFPLNFFVLKRASGTMYIFERPGAPVLARFDQKTILYSKTNSRFENGSNKVINKNIPADFQHQFDL